VWGKGNLPFKEQLHTHSKKPPCTSKQTIPGEQACSVQYPRSSHLRTGEKHIKWNQSFCCYQQQ